MSIDKDSKRLRNVSLLSQSFSLMRPMNLTKQISVNNTSITKNRLLWSVWFCFLLMSSKSYYKKQPSECSIKKVFLTILQNLQEKTFARVSFLIKRLFTKNKTLAQFFPSDICEIFENTYFIEHLKAIASVLNTKRWTITCSMQGLACIIILSYTKVAIFHLVKTVKITKCFQ